MCVYGYMCAHMGFFPTVMKLCYERVLNDFSFPHSFGKITNNLFMLFETSWTSDTKARKIKLTPILIKKFIGEKVSMLHVD